MKKILLFSMTLFAGLGAGAQERSERPSWIAGVNPGHACKPQPVEKKGLGADELPPIPFTNVHQPNRTVVARTSSIPTITEIGSTYYDLQTNSCPRNVITVNADGSISAVWTFSGDQSASPPVAYADRGTGYNYFDGTAWSLTVPTTARIEDVKTGWGNIAVTQSGKELAFSHGSTTGALTTEFVSRAAKGTGAWSTLGPTGNTGVWPRVAVGGANGESVHLIAVTQTAHKGQTGAILYSRSQDGGTTWDQMNVVIAGVDSIYSTGYGADNYNIDANGSTIAIVAGGFDQDVTLLKSTDNGTTWTHTAVYDFPIPRYDAGSMVSDTTGDGIGDTLTSNDGCVYVLLDNNNKAHVWYGRMRVLDADTVGGMSYFPDTDGLMYWNENMGSAPPRLIAGILDTDGNGVWTEPASGASPTGIPFGIYYTSMTSYPTAGIDASGTLFLSYCSIKDASDNGEGKAFRGVFVMTSQDGGNTWSAPFAVKNDDALEEQYYANIAKRVDATNAHIIMQADYAPGDGFHGSGAPDLPGNIGNPNRILYVQLPKSDVISVKDLASENFSISTNYPNPFSGSTSIELVLKASSEVMADVHNALGQRVWRMERSVMGAGTHILNVDGSKLSAGLYFYTVRVGDNAVTQKMIVE